MAEEKELKPRAKEEAPAKGERVRPGRVFLPAVDIFETPEALTLVADMPGVPPEKMTVDVKDNHLIISGEIAPPLAEKETLLMQEYYTGDFYREFQLGAMIDQGRIEATMKDGVLRLLLPKVETAKPRKIEVKVA
jgi:HSP20 family protein